MGYETTSEISQSGRVVYPRSLTTNHAPLKKSLRKERGQATLPDCKFSEKSFNARQQT